MNTDTQLRGFVRNGPAEWFMPLPGKNPITLIATEKLLLDMDERCIEQAINTANTPGVERLIINPDAHAGYGCPVGSVVITKDTVMPGPVGPDIGCSMSYLQTDVPAAAIKDKRVRRALIDAITARIPTGMGNRLAPKGRGEFKEETLRSAAVWGRLSEELKEIGIPEEWGARCDFTSITNLEDLEERLAVLKSENSKAIPKMAQLGSYGGGNHFGECQITHVSPWQEDSAKAFGLLDGHVGFLNHCGSRGFGYTLSAHHFKAFQKHFEDWSMAFPGGDKELVYAPVGTDLAYSYVVDMELAANFATVNHLLICQLVSEAFREIFGNVDTKLVYHISHNIGTREPIEGELRWIWRKGATKASRNGHPILLPGNPQAGSRIMTASNGAIKTAHSINHGAGRRLGRKEAKRTLNQTTVDEQLLQADILSNCRSYPIDEAPAAYKDFNEVCSAVEQADLAKTVATLQARFVIKDGDQDREGWA